MSEFLSMAIRQAELGLAQGGIPIGSVLVHREKIIGAGFNHRVQNGSVILHGEMDALENAGRHGAEVYQSSTLYTTLSPCSMCTGAILLYKIPRVVIGENQNFRGEEALLKQRGVDVQIVQDQTCIKMMREFINQHPELWFEDIGE
jgi:cytosine deaminase